MADPHPSTRVLPDPEPRLERMLRRISDAQTAQWRFRLFGPLKGAAVLSVEQTAMPVMTNPLRSRSWPFGFDEVQTDSSRPLALASAAATPNRSIEFEGRRSQDVKISFSTSRNTASEFRLRPSTERALVRTSSRAQSACQGLTMQVRDITQQEFEDIAAELRDLKHIDGAVESIEGLHPVHGRTLLIRDAMRCLALVEDATELDRRAITNAFIEGGFVLSPATVAGRC